MTNISMLFFIFRKGCMKYLILRRNSTVKNDTNAIYSQFNMIVNYNTLRTLHMKFIMIVIFLKNDRNL